MGSQTPQSAKSPEGAARQKLADYLARLRPPHKTRVLSNSFVGARERASRRITLICTAGLSGAEKVKQVCLTSL
jgi:hypothetical protein